MPGSRLHVVSGRRAVRALTHARFVTERVVGSHHVMVFPTDPTRTVTVPVHSGRDLNAATLRSIIRQAGMTVEEFAALSEGGFTYPSASASAT